MDENQRLELIRAKLTKRKAVATAKPQGLFKTTNPDACRPPRKTGYVKSAALKDYRSPFGIILPGGSAHMMDWIYSPEEAPAERKDKQRKGPHHLTKIAEKWLHARKY